jgi:HK97 family phage prohead protease
MNRFHCGLIELKFAPADAAAANDMTFEGYGAVFGNVDAYGDVIEPGAFASYLSDVRNGKQQWPAMLLQHGGWGASADDMTPIGVWTELAEDGRGLKVKGQLADTPRGREIYTLMKMAPRPAIDGLSIGYIPKEFEMRSKPEDPRRRLKRVDLIEISPVTFPANTSARVASVKSTSGLTIRDAERALRDAGFSRSEAKAVLASGYRSIDDVRDADDELTTLAATIQRNIATLTGVPHE